MSVYLDYAAATPLDPCVEKVMRPFFQKQFGNPSSFHTPGKEAKEAIQSAREKIADILQVRPDEILFTSGGTESDNLAVLGVARANFTHGKHVIVSAIEHHAVLEAALFLEKKEGFSVTYLKPDRDGIVTAKQVRESLRPETTLVSVMYANNEIGTIQPIAEIGNAIQKYRAQQKTVFPVFHTDACQAAGYLDINVEKLHVDLLTLNGNKIYGPKGTGLLYIKRGIKIQPLQFGGAQERGLRPGTENVGGIVGLAEALKITQTEKEKEAARLAKLRDFFISELLSKLPKVRLNGHSTKRLPNNVNVSCMDVEGEALLLYLDAAGIYASTGSACASASLDPSHVILALGLPYEVSHGSLRFSLGRSTTKKDIQTVLKILPPLVEKLRAISPVKVDEKYFS